MSIIATEWNYPPAEASFRLRDQTYINRFGQKPHNVGESYWSFEWTLPPINDDKARDVETDLYNMEGINMLSVYDPRRIFPKAHPKGSGALTGTVTNMSRGSKEITIAIPTGQTVSKGDALSFKTAAGVTHYFQASETVTSTGVIFDIGVNPRPRRSEFFAGGLPLVRKYARCVFSVELNSADMSTDVNLYSDISISGVEFFGATA